MGYNGLSCRIEKYLFALKLYFSFSSNAQYERVANIFEVVRRGLGMLPQQAEQAIFKKIQKWNFSKMSKPVHVCTACEFVNAILMDSDLLRKYERLTAIQDAFVAYPPFWYHYGNTANSIAQSDLPLSNATREQYRTTAKNHFFQYRNSNQYSLLREDPVSASCALELLELHDFNNDANLIRELLEEAIKYSGRANDVLQLASISYLKLNDSNSAANLLRQLVNEQ